MSENNISLKKFFIAVGVILGIFGTFGGYIIYQNTKPSEVTVQETFSVEDSTKKNIEDSTIRFLNKAGNFGMDYSKINGNTVYNISRILKLDGQDSSTYFTERSVVYNNIVYRDNLIASASPLDFPQSNVLSWGVQQEKDNMLKYEVISVKPTGNITGTITQDGSNKKIIESEALVDSRVSKIIQTATDSSWDGTYDRMEKSFNQVLVKVYFIETDEGWKVYDMKTNNPYLFVTWNNPNYNDMSNDMFGFSTVETYTPAVSPQEAFKQSSK